MCGVQRQEIRDKEMRQRLGKAKGREKGCGGRTTRESGRKEVFKCIN